MSINNTTERRSFYWSFFDVDKRWFSLFNFTIEWNYRNLIGTLITDVTGLHPASIGSQNFLFYY